MSQCSQRWIWLFVYLLLWNPSFAELEKGATTSPSDLDFNTDGRVDENDLLSLLDRMGAIIGEEKYDVIHDLKADGILDDQDLLFYVLGWKQGAPRFEPITTAEFLQQTGLSNLSGNAWRFRCLAGGTEDCSGEERTVTGGALTEIGGRTVLPIIWGSGTGEPWDILYLTVDGNLAYMGVEKVAEPNGFPGIVVPPQQIGISGPIPWTTSEIVYPGSILETEGEVSMELGFDKTLFFIGAKCLVTTELNNKRVNAERLECSLESQRICAAELTEEGRRACFQYRADICDNIEKGGSFEDPAFLYSGAGVLETTGGLRAEADWNLLFVREELVFIQLCWEILGQRKCLSFGRIFDASGSNCLSSIPEQEVEIEHCGLFHNDITEGECLTGFVGSGIDLQDWVRLNQQGTAGRVAVTIRHSVPSGSEGLAQLWRFPPNCTAGDLLDFANFTGDGVAVVESPFITAGPNVYVIVSPEGDQGAAGGPIAYEVQFENQ